jgi:hypothetical protein
LQKAEQIEQKSNGIEIVLPNATYLGALQAKEHRAVLDYVAADLVGKSIERVEPDSGKATESAREDPQVKRFLEVFRGDLAQVKPLKGE